MDDFAGIALILIAIALAIPLIQFIAIVMQVLRLRIWPTRFLPEAEAPSLTPDQQAAVAEIEALGFRRSGFGWMEQGPMRYGCQFFQHPAEPAVAALSLRPGVYAGYPVTFYSIDGANRMLMTTNRVAWAILATADDSLVEDAYADSLSGHWQFHRARIAGLKDSPANEAIESRVVAEVPRTFEAALATDALRGRGGRWHPSLRAALRTGVAWFKVRARLARPVCVG
jgi:hypothetical protein